MNILKMIFLINNQDKWSTKYKMNKMKINQEE